MRPQRLGDAGAQLVGLDEHGGQRIDVLDSGATGQTTQRVAARQTGPDLLVGQKEFVAERGAGDGDLLAHPLHAGVQSESRLHADDQEVQRVREGALDLTPPVLALEIEPEGRDVEADQRRDATLDQDGSDRPGQGVVDGNPSEAQRNGQHHLAAQKDQLGPLHANARRFSPSTSASRASSLPAGHLTKPPSQSLNIC